MIDHISFDIAIELIELELKDFIFHNQKSTN